MLACELWGFQKSTRNASRVLQLPLMLPSTANVAVYGEVGKMPMDLALMVRYWIRLASSFYISYFMGMLISSTILHGGNTFKIFVYVPDEID